MKEQKIRQYPKIKCVIWDCDNTLWDGILAEDQTVMLRQQVVEVIRKLDERGILQSIASRNNFDDVNKILKQFKIEEFFLYPQIHWGAKSASVREIIDALNISADTVAFVDDQEYERCEVASTFSEILCIAAEDIMEMVSWPCMIPEHMNEDTRRRRELYQIDYKRRQSEKAHTGPQEDFLRSLNMEITISEAVDGDLSRIIELTERTHQLNTTGYVYTYQELEGVICSNDKKLFIIGLEDNFGSYGKVGMILLSVSENLWVIDLFILSCRVMSRGIGSILITYIAEKAKEEGVTLQARFVSTERNKAMHLTYRLTGFQYKEEKNGYSIYQNDFTCIQQRPDYVTLIEKRGSGIGAR